MQRFLKNFWNDTSGATAVEYGIIAMMIFVAIVAVLGQIGSSLTSIFTSVNNGFGH